MTPEEIKEMQEKLSSLEGKVNDLSTENKKLKAAVAGPAPEEKPELPTAAFEVDKAKYKFVVAKFFVPGVGVVTAKEALTDKELLKKLVKEESGVIEEVG